MSKVCFSVYGHSNIRAAHKTTFEFTKDIEVTTTGDCIVGVNADFSIQELQQFLVKPTKVLITIECENEKRRITATTNPGFCYTHEMVIRKTDFISDRTFAIHASAAAVNLNRRIISRLQTPKQMAVVTIKKLSE